MATAGAILSEYGPGTPPAPWRFPARNRIVAALGQSVVVVEAARTSGALITAGFALEIGREVLAVPASPWVDAAAGGNALLRDGAGIVTCAGDVLVTLGIDPAAAAGEEREAVSPEAHAAAAVDRPRAGHAGGARREAGAEAGEAAGADRGARAGRRDRPRIRRVAGGCVTTPGFGKHPLHKHRDP